MKKLIFAIALGMAFSAGAFAAVDCNSVGLCKFNGVLSDGTDCSQQECPVFFGQSDTPGGRENVLIALSDGLQCENLDFDHALRGQVQAGPDGFIAVALTFTQDPPPGFQYSLGVFFSGCEQSGRCGGFTAGDPNPDCMGGSRDLNFTILHGALDFAALTEK